MSNSQRHHDKQKQREKKVKKVQRSGGCTQTAALIYRENNQRRAIQMGSLLYDITHSSQPASKEG